MSDNDWYDLLDAFEWVTEPPNEIAHAISESELLRAIVRGELSVEEL